MLPSSTPCVVSLGGQRIHFAVLQELQAGWGSCDFAQDVELALLEGEPNLAAGLLQRTHEWVERMQTGGTIVAEQCAAGPAALLWRPGDER